MSKITSDSIAETHQFMQKKYPNLTTNMMSVVNQQRIDERRQLHVDSTLPIQDIEKKLPGVDLNKLREEMAEEFDQPGVMDAASQILRGVYYHAEHTNGKLSDAAEVANWFTSGKRIGAPSANGLVVITSLRTAKDIAVIKAPLKKDKQLDMVHEVFVATHGTNFLRGKIPNFAYVYGGFQCAPSVFDTKGKLISLCGTGKERTQYIVYETISPAIDFHEAVSNDAGEDRLTPETLFNYFLQVALATYMAWKAFDWTHYDLHSENVMLRRVPHHPKFTMQYDFKRNGKDEKIYVTSDRVATIIDFGYSHIKTKGQCGSKKQNKCDYGYSIPTYGVFPERSFPLFDMYKLLLFIASDAVYAQRKDLIEVLGKMYEYFSDEHILDAVENQIEYYYYLPESLAEGLSMEGFIDHLLKSFPKYKGKVWSNTQPSKLPVLGCQNNCKNVSDVTRDLETDEVHEVIDLYDIITSEAYEYKILEDFGEHYHPSMNRHIEAMAGHVKEYNNSIKEIAETKYTPEEIKKMPLQQLFSSKTLLRIQKYRDAIVKASFVLGQINLYITSGREVAQYFNDDESLKVFDKARKEHTEYDVKQKNRVLESKKLAEVLKDIATNKGNEYVRKDKAFKWYINPM